MAAGTRIDAVTDRSGHDLGLAALGFLELDPPALLDVAAGAGFTSVSVRSRAAVAGGAVYPLTPGSVLHRETQARIRATGVRILQVELVSLAPDLDVAACRPMLEGGASLGATRVVAAGDDPDPERLADRLASLCDLAAEYSLVVDVEFMPFRSLATLGQALGVVARAGRANAAVMIDALHLFRSGGTVADVVAAPPGLIGVCQLCDAPLAAPAHEWLATEAREHRLLPGQGELPLEALIDALPAGTLLAAEVPIGRQYPDDLATERARRVFDATARLMMSARR